MVSLNVFFSFDACREQASMACVDARAYNTIVKGAHVQQVIQEVHVHNQVKVDVTPWRQSVFGAMKHHRKART